MSFSNNVAPVGTTFATQPTLLTPVPATATATAINVTNYGTSLIQPTLVFALRDYYGNVNTTDSASSVLATVVPGYDCRVRACASSLAAPLSL
jgi:hypothetical protein